MDFVGDGFQVGHDLRVAKCAVTTGKEMWFSFCLIWNDLMTSRMVFTSSVIVPLAVGCKPARPRFWRQISMWCHFLSGKCVGEHIWGQFLVDKLVEQLSAAKVSIPAFQLFDYWLLGGEDDWFGFLCTGNGISTFPRIGATLVPDARICCMKW